MLDREQLSGENCHHNTATHTRAHKPGGRLMDPRIIERQQTPREQLPPLFLLQEEERDVPTPRPVANQFSETDGDVGSCQLSGVFAAPPQESR